MALQCRGEELNGHSQGRSYPSPSGDIRKAQQVGPPVGKSMKKPSENFMKGKNLAYSSNGVSLRHSNNMSKKKVQDIHVPADTCADDSDDDVEIVWERPGLPRYNGSLLGTNVKLNIEGSSRMNKKGITGLQPSDVSNVNILNNEVVGTSSTMKRIDSSGRINLNLSSSEDNLEEKRVAAASGSKFFVANEETRHSNSYNHKKDGKIFLI
jgi:hypothetical protein